jgi:hypothetical protein
VVCDDCLTKKIQIEFIPSSSSNHDGRFENFTSTFFSALNFALLKNV